MKKKKVPLSDEEVRVIKIGENALFEFIYETFIDKQEAYMNLDRTTVTNSFYIDWDSRQFVFCAYKSENDKGEWLELPQSIDFERLAKEMPDTTESMYAENRYKTFTKDQLEDMCK